jgi:iron(III) transport system ATP-binding protein
LSALDALERVRLRGEIRALQQRLGVTTVMVTHDQEEALSMADRIVVMNHGCIDQVGTPREIYETPVTPFVADFIGKVNVLAATAEGGGRYRVGSLSLAAGGRDIARGTAVKLYLRPEDVAVSVNGAHSGVANTLAGKVAKVEFLGAFCMVGIQLDSGGAPTLVANVPRQKVDDGGIVAGAPVTVGLPPTAIRILG